MLGDISYIKLLYNPRVNIVFTFTFRKSKSIRQFEFLETLEYIYGK